MNTNCLLWLPLVRWRRRGREASGSIFLLRSGGRPDARTGAPFLGGRAAPGPRRDRAALGGGLRCRDAPIVAEQLVQLALGDAYQELVQGTGSPAPEIFERQIDAALVLLGLMSRRPRQRNRTGRPAKTWGW